MRQRNSALNAVVGVVYLLTHIAASFIITSLVLNSFGSSVNGLVSSIKQLLSYLALVEGGLGVACIMSYYPALASDNKVEVSRIFFSSERYFRIIGLIFFSLLIILCFIYPFIIKTDIGYAKVFFIVFITGLSTVLQFVFLEKYQSVIIADQKNRIVQLFSCVSELLQVCFVYICIKIFSLGIFSVQALYTLSMVVRIILCEFFFRKNYKYIIEQKKNFISKNEYKNAIKQKSASLIHVIAQQISFSTDLVVLSVAKGLVEVSIYSVYNLMLSTANYIFSILSSAVSSSFGDLFYKDKPKAIDKYEIFEFLSVFVATIIAAVLAFIIRPFISLYVKVNDSGLYWNYVYSFLFVAISFFNSIRTPQAMMIRVSGNFEKTKFIFLGEALFNLSLSLLLVGEYGITGVLIGTLFSAIFRDIFVISFVYRNVLEKKIYSFLRMIISNMVLLLLLCICSTIYSPTINSYLGLFIYACCSLLVITIFTVIVNLIFSKTMLNKSFKQMISILKAVI